MDKILAQANNAWRILKYVNEKVPLIENPLSAIYSIIAWILGAIALYNFLKKYR